jgi:hypothetical protein
MKSLDRLWILCAAAALLLLLASSAPADVINLPEGVFGAREFTAGNTYVGVPGKTIFKGSGVLKVTGNNVTLRNFTCDGFGIRRDGNLSGLVIDNVEIRNAGVAVEINGGSDVTIRNCLMERCNYATWIGDMSNLLVEFNEAREVGYGFKAFGDSGANKNRTWRNNWVHDCGPDFMAFELQGACDGWNLIDNVVERIRFGPTLESNDHSLIVSVPMAKSRNGTIRGNAFLGAKPKGAGYPNAWINGHPAIVEAGGDSTLIDTNLVDGGGVGITITDGDGPCSVTLKNNRIANNYGNWNRSAQQNVMLVGTNDATTALPFTVEQKRAAAGRNKALAPTPEPDNTPPPATLPSDVVARLDQLEKGMRETSEDATRANGRLDNLGAELKAAAAALSKAADAAK